MPRASLLTRCLVRVAARVPSAAELHVVATSPARNTTAPALTAVRIDFDAAIDPATISVATVRVFGRGRGSGTAAGTLALSNDNQSVTLIPTRPFSAGETVLINLSHADLPCAAPRRAHRPARRAAIAPDGGRLLRRPP